MKYVYPFLVAIAVVLVVLNTPAQWYSFDHWFGKQKLGTAFTTLLGTNQLSNFPTTYNANLTLTANQTAANTFTASNVFSASNSFTGGLNTFLNSSSTQLSTGRAWFGTTATSSFSTAGALTLITPLTVPNGGTGSTTLSQYQILLGNGSGNVTVPIGWGTSGQVFTSAGPGVIPAWSSGAVDTSLNYNWIGTNLFKNFNASGTVANPTVINGLSLTWPGSAFNNSTSTNTSVLTQDGSGNFKFSPTTYLVATSTTAVSIASNTGSTTLATITVPANSLGTGNMLVLAIPVNSFAIQSTDSVSVCVTYSTQAICDLSIAGVNSTNNSSGYIYVTLMANGTQAQRLRYDAQLYATGQLTGSGSATNGFIFHRTRATTVDSTSAQTLNFSIKFNTSDANDRISTDGYYATMLH